MKTLDDLRLRPRELTAIREASHLLRERFPVEQVILFGCKARGDDDPESDIDLLVLTRRPLSRPEKHALIKAIFPLQLAYEVVLSPLVIHAEEWRSGLTSFLPIHDEIAEQGVTA